jgi:hypothetical protein
LGMQPGGGRKKRAHGGTAFEQGTASGRHESNSEWG